MERPSAAMMFWETNLGMTGCCYEAGGRGSCGTGDGWTGEELKDEELKDEELKEEELKDEDLRVGVAIPSTRLARSKDAVVAEHSIVELRCGRNELDGVGWHGDQEA